MVFEGIVVELVNKYLGDFIENLDKSQLKIGLWGGDVVLNNLYIKENALDDLDLPVKVLHGNLGKLVLKVPWKNLYTEPTVATLDGLYVVAVPNLGVKYNAEKEAKNDFDKKQKELARIEEAKRIEEEKGKEKEEKADSFGEKLASNIIKNLQIQVSNIHIRFEDHFTNPKKPFSVGVTLKGLDFQTCDENWKPKTIKETVTMIYKRIQLDSLSAYWNPNTKSFLRQDRETLLNSLKGNIASPGAKTDFHYLIEPISSSAQLTLHTKPEKDQYSIPKILLNVVIQEIGIALNKKQYQNVMELLESMERMTLASMYRKYERPDVNFKGHANCSLWWKYAYRCILGERVRRRRNMWSWNHIKAHRQLCRDYKELYKKKLLSSKVSADMTKQLEGMEKEMSVFNITMVRQQADLETKDKRQKQQSGGGWFSGWFGGKKEEKKDDIAGQFQKAMTPEEKARLYDAIGYQENTADPTLPKDYVANKLSFKLGKLSLKLKDPERSEPQVVDVQVQDLIASVNQRPAAEAIKVETKVDSFTVYGCPTKEGVPAMVSSQNKDTPYSLLDLLFETNPLDGKADTRVNVNTRPLEIVYDANTINQVADFFKPPEEVYLKQIQAAAFAKFEDLREQTATGLQHAIEQHKFTDLNVNVQPCYIIVPDKGVYRKDATLIVLDLGSLKVNSEKQQISTTDDKGEQVAALKKLDVEEIKAKAYDKFNVQLQQIQLLMAKPGEDWRSARKGASHMHILNPMALNISIFKSMLEDVNLPKMKVNGELPSLSVNMSDVRLKEILDLVQSIPFPESSPPPPQQEIDYNAPDLDNMALEPTVATQRVLRTMQDADADPGSRPALKTQTSQEYVNLTDLEVKFVLKEIALNLSQVKDGKEVPTLKVVISSLGTEVKMRTFDMMAAAYLGGIYVQYQQMKELQHGPLINLINTPAEESTAQLLFVEYLKANIKGPEFSTTYKNTEQSIKVNFSALEVMLHLEAILALLEFAQKLQPPPAAQPAPAEPAPVEEAIKAETGTKTQAAPGQKARPLIKIGKKRKVEQEVIDLAVAAQLDIFKVTICTEKSHITDIAIKGLEANVAMSKSKIDVSASLKDINIFDPRKDAIYTKILSFEGSDVFKVGVTLYNEGTKGDKVADLECVDMRISAEFGCMRVVFLNLFVNNILGFLNHFQTAMEQVKQAGTAAAENAASAAQEAAATMSRMALSINLKAPVIVVPQSSTSHNALVVDLGTLTLANTFHAQSATNEKGHPAILDDMVVELTSLKVTRAELFAGAGKKECLLIQPVNVKVTLIRNLSVSWYHDKPEVDIAGNINAFAVTLSQGDFSLIMKVLNENLTEGAPPPAVGTAPAAAAPAEAAKPVETQPDTATKQEEAETQAETTQAETGEAKVQATQAVTAQATPELPGFPKLKFDFRLETINATLYTGDSDLDTGGRDNKRALGKFELRVIAVEGLMNTDNTMSAKVILNNIVVEDMRPSRAGGITKMIERSQKGISFDNTANMIDVSFDQKKNMDKNVVVHVSSLYICVCLDFLMRLADFATKGMEASPQQPGDKEKAPASSSSSPVPVAPAEAPKPPEGEMCLTLVVEKPEIILVENSADLNTKALVLDTEVDFKMRMNADQQQMSGGIKGFNIYACLFDPPQRESSKVLVLNPIDVSLHANTPKDQGMHAEIQVTDIVVNISPAVIQQLTATMSGLSPQPEEGEDTTLKDIPSNLWLTQKIADCNFQFLKMPEKAEDAVDDTIIGKEGSGEGAVVEPVVPRGEQMLMEVPRIVVTLEGGVGTRTLPLLITEMSMRAEVRDWSTKLYVTSDLSLEVAYYNERLTVWEPLLEPVETEKGALRPWEINVEVEANDDFVPLDDEDDTTFHLPPPKMTVNIQSNDMMQVTLSKTGLEVLQNLGKAFGDAYYLKEAKDVVDAPTAPYSIKNDSGLQLSVRPDDSFKRGVGGQVQELTPGDSLGLYPADRESQNKEQSVIRSADEEVRKITIMLEEFGASRELKIERAEKRLFEINQKVYPGDAWCLVCQTQSKFGCKTITLRSVLQVSNELPVSMEVYYKLGNDAMGRCGEMEPGQSMNVPLEAVYAAPYELYFKPRGNQYKECAEPLLWKDMEAGKPANVVSCEAYKNGEQPFHFTVSKAVEDIFYEATPETTAKAFTLQLKPCAVFRNLLPIPVVYTLEGTGENKEIKGGHKDVLLNAKVGSTVEVRIPKYQNKEWIGKRTIEANTKELTVWSFEAQDESGTDSMDLGLFCNTIKGYQDWSLYCPYWILNKTGKTLMYKACDSAIKVKKKGTDDNAVTQPADDQTALLFSFKSKSVLGKKKGDSDEEMPKKGGTLRRSKSKGGNDTDSPKKAKKVKKKTMKASLKMEDSEWSDKFSLDTVGSAGTVSCKVKGTTHEVGVQISLASSGLTKIVVFTPYYLLVNQAKFPISCRECVEGAPWVDIDAEQCKPFWPTEGGKKMQMEAKVKDTEACTKPFAITKAHTTLLPIEHDYKCINVECQVMESSIHTVFQHYQAGMATARLVNHTSNANITYRQQGVTDDTRVLAPGETVLYTWQDPNGDRKLLWSGGEKKEQKDELVKDGLGDFFFDSDTKIFWVSFLDGMQRVLLFTEDLVLATLAQQAGELERVEMETVLSLRGFGLSLVNNYVRKEIAYMGITSSGVIWEEKKRKRYKALKAKHCQTLEAAWTKYKNELAVGKAPQGPQQLEHKLQVDFGTMHMVKPRKCQIRRSFENGIWVQHRTSPHQLQLHAKIHRLQLDNQLQGAIFQTVLAPMPLPKSVANESVPKPFTEASIMIRKRDHTTVLQFKYFKILTQEMALKVDQPFLNAIIELFAGEEASEEDKRAAYDADCKMISTQLKDEAAKVSASGQKNFYDELHISPLKVHISFSMYSGGDEKKPAHLHSNVINLFLQSVGVVLSDVQDVIFRLGYFERKHTFYNQQQLTGQIIRHYTGQAIKQMYVLVLGLDVLGNPFGVVTGLGEGIKDLFYEPYAGAVQGPEEFAEGMALGVRSLLGHAVGGAAGAVSRITGALGKGIATLTFDEDYQKKRREQMNRQPTGLKEGLAQGGKGLVMGVFDGVTGIVRKPVEGAKQEGAKGFFKGLGKGAVGVFTRPASGVVDFASTSFEGIRRTADMAEEVRRLRPPRFLHQDMVVRAYNFREAEGNGILQDMEKGKYAEDQYIGHVIVTKDGKNILLVTDKRVIFVTKGQIFGQWDCEWQYVWADLKEPPSATSKGVQILLKEMQKKSFFHSGTVGKLVPMENKDAVEWIVGKMTECMAKAQ